MTGSLRNGVFDHTTDETALVRFLRRFAICVGILALKMPEAMNCSDKQDAIVKPATG